MMFEIANQQWNPVCVKKHVKFEENLYSLTILKMFLLNGGHWLTGDRNRCVVRINIKFYEMLFIIVDII